MSTSRSSKKFARSPRCLTRGKYLNNVPLKRRMYALCKCLMDYTVRVLFNSYHSNKQILFEMFSYITDRAWSCTYVDVYGKTIKENLS